MIVIADLQRRAKSYLRSARVLARNAHGEYDAAAYLCGYAVEIALKARICRTLGWAGYPSSKKEFEGLSSYQTHNLGMLLHLSGIEWRITTDPLILIEWSVVLRWNPEQRYNPPGTMAQADATDMIASVAKILKVVL